jgi:NADH-quinone oxidoreductase subunit M
MLSHGLSTGGLFLLVGIIYQRRHTRLIADFGGLWKQIPRFSVAFLIIMLASIGLPGLNGFVGEFLILLGAFEASPAAAALATLGIILGAVYMLWMFQRVVFGPLDNEENQKLTDLTTREMVVLAPVLTMIFVMGIYPQPFLTRVRPSVDAFVARVDQRVAAAEKAGSPLTQDTSTDLRFAANHGADPVGSEPIGGGFQAPVEIAGPGTLAR